MPELSLSKKTSRSQKILGSFELSADQIEAIRQLVELTIAEVERGLIIRTLADQRGSRTEAAKLLGISIRTLRNKIHRYNARGKIVPNQPPIKQSPRWLIGGPRQAKGSLRGRRI